MDSKPPPDPEAWHYLGLDFSSAPSRRKPIWLARGAWLKGRLCLQSLQSLPSMDGFEAALREPGPWIGGFDLPLGLPRVFVDAMGWGPDLGTLAVQLRGRFADRAAWRRGIDAWGATRPLGQRLPHRRCDIRLPAGARSTSPLQSRYVPVALMLYEGLPRLLDAGVSLVGQHAGDARRLALEAYPGWLARQLLGRRSYKNRDDAATRTARAELVDALLADAAGLGLALALPAELRALMLADASGDPLDAWLCLLQAAWAARQPRWGQPDDLDALEGWICGAEPARD